MTDYAGVVAIISLVLAGVLLCILVFVFLRYPSAISPMSCRRSKPSHIEPFVTPYAHSSSCFARRQNTVTIPPNSHRALSTRTIPSFLFSPLRLSPASQTPPHFVYNIQRERSRSVSSAGTAAPMFQDALPVRVSRAGALSPYSSGRMSAAMQSSAIHGPWDDEEKGFYSAPAAVSFFPTSHVRE